ncbi:hypothetical protein [Shinella fusca]|uniref:Uncharacterized protein n=1 Tax=Shinella fusca TaxID=544480 RepID=A0A7W7YR51_9HYPH|nr:hypothetical protein [Shinella fusca]MBB5040810.1 hypothetical protein [Shinella fusca]
MKPNEADFVNEALSSEEIEALDAPEATQEPEPQPDSVSDTTKPDTQQPEADQPKMVDVRALQESRAAERELREQMAREREERIRLEERTNQMLQRIEESRQPAKQVPDKETDPLAFYEYEIQQLREQNEQFQAAERQRQEAAQQQQAVQQTLDEAGFILDQAMAKYPDVKDAFDHSVNATREGLKKQGLYGAQLEQAMQRHIYEYASRAPRDADQMAEFVRANGRYWGWSAPAPAPAQPSVQDLAQRQERHMSLGGVAGGEAPKPLDAKALAQMSDAEFNKLMSTVAGRKQIDEIMGS